MTVDSSTSNRSPRSPVTSADGVYSPQSLRGGLPSPWVQVVRGESEAISVVPRSPSSSYSSPSPPIATPEQATFSDCSGLKGQSLSLSPPGNSATETQLESSDSSSGNVGRPKRPAWNKHLNGVVEVGPVMGAVSWPALSESTRPSPKGSSDSSKRISDESVSISQGPVISHSPLKQANANANANPNFTPIHTQPVRQRSMKRGGSTGGGSHSGFSRPPPPPPPPLPPPFPVFDITYGNMVPAVLESPMREPLFKGHDWETRPMGIGSQSHAVNDHSSQRNYSRRGNFGPRPRGGGLYRNGYGGRRDQDREWNSPRSSTARDAHVPHQMVPPPPRGFIRPSPPSSTPFITPLPVRPFGNPLGFDMAPPFLYVPTLPPESFRGAPLIAHAPAQTMFFPVMDTHHLPTLLVNQINYYFSDANLVKDEFLRSKMDDQGWVPVTLIASFPRVQHLTNNIYVILDSLRASTIVEVQGDRIRRRNEWRKWIPSDSGSQSPGGSTDSMLTTSFQKVTLDETTTNQNSTKGPVNAHTELVPGRFSSEELTGQSKLASGVGPAEEACSSQI